jgi:lysozyme family protein
MKANYTPFIARVIQRYEGGYGWDRGDPGGPTKYGITCFDLAEHRGQRMTSMAAWAPLVKAMTLQEAEAIYVTKYANGLYFDSLRAGPDCCVLDYGINSGVARPLRVARTLLNYTAAGNAGLIDAINKAHAADPKWIVDAMCQERLHFMHAIRSGSAWAEFGKGWGERVKDVDTYCDNLAAGTTLPNPPEAPTVPHPKVVHGDPNASASTTKKTVATGASAGAAAHAAGLPHWVVPAVVVGVAAVGIGFALYESRKHALANATVVIPPTVPPMPAAVAAAVGVQDVPKVAQVV